MRQFCLFFCCFLSTALKISPQLKPNELTVGRTVIPTLARAGWKSRAEFRQARADMFARGLYPGVDYIIEERNRTRVIVRPIYPLVKKLEREDWPVSVDIALAPRWMDPAAYNLLTAFFALALAGTGLAIGFLLSLFFTFSAMAKAAVK